ncbi:hypothetical protein [Kitasatospora sp. LaBMicrA B282]|uniref:hypothetical protein n=1 Tax=Kitasatospora sp. LaBMicrA B282 TaxID=3420949 RepID=UPI003D10CDF1
MRLPGSGAPEPVGYDLGPDPDLGLWLAEWPDYYDRIIHFGPDDGRDPGQLCWDVLTPSGLLAPHCPQCRHRGGHGGPRSPQQLDTALHVRIPPAEAPAWFAATLERNLVYTNGWTRSAMTPLAEALGTALADLLGPDADWRANGYAAYWEGSPNRSWQPVTEATFDAALVGIGGGHAVVVVATGED